MLVGSVAGLASSTLPGCHHHGPFDEGSADAKPEDLVEAGTGHGMDATLGGGFIDAEVVSSIAIMPQNPMLEANGANGPPTTQAFQAFLNGTADPTPAVWGVDVASIGTIDANGLFTPTGTLGGTTRVTAAIGNVKASTNITVRLHLSDNPGNVDLVTQDALKAGGSDDSDFKWLYPYDKTVFPRGLRPPTLQFAGVSAEAIYVHITASTFEYQGFYGSSNPLRVSMTEALWKTITLSVNAKDPVKIEVTKISGGKVTGPERETLFIAQGSLKGTVYYNTYNSPQAGGEGAVMRVKANAANAEVLIGASERGEGCTVCHAVSANGSVLVASHSNYTSGASWDLTQTAPDGGAVVMHEEPSSTFSFGGISPDGEYLMSNAALPGGWPPNVPGQMGSRPSRLYDTKTGVIIPAPGWDGVIENAITPTFAQNGKRLAFNNYDKDVGPADGGVDNLPHQGHTLSVVDFEPATKTFSPPIDLFSEPTSYPAWPAFTPDGDWVVFHNGNARDYATWNGSKADLFIAHIPSRTVTKLDALNGYANGAPYLPYGEEEAHLNYEPTILPVAVGGYYWAVFTSRRKYGNTIVGNSQEQQDRKKLWIAAIDIESNEVPHTAAYDKSHPAFYLSSQELEAGNMRGFWALDPCKQNGNSCETGDECCGGFCRQQNDVDGAAQLVCVVPPVGCANEFEKCTSSASCCGAPQGYQCLNEHCAKPLPK